VEDGVVEGDGAGKRSGSVACDDAGEFVTSAGLRGGDGAYGRCSEAGDGQRLCRGGAGFAGCGAVGCSAEDGFDGVSVGAEAKWEGGYSYGSELGRADDG
jgi:hypothetical protein